MRTNLIFAAAALLVFGSLILLASCTREVSSEPGVIARAPQSAPEAADSEPVLAADETASPSDQDKLIPVGKAVAGKAIAEGKWINSEPLTLEGLRGRVVLIDFWTFGCYNCVNTLPTLKSLDK